MTFKQDLLSGKYKKNELKDAKYLEFVRSLPCVLSETDGAVPHHLIGYGYSGVGTKASDYLVFPLRNYFHTGGPNAIHRIGADEWEAKYNSQWEWVVLTQRKWIIKISNEPVRDLIIDLRWSDEKIALTQMQWLMEKKK